MKEPEARLPFNADRAALAKILVVIQSYEVGERKEITCKAAIREVQRIAISALNEPTQPGDYWHRWLPDAEHINALPCPLRAYIHDLETRADPAGDVATVAFLKDTVDALQARIRELESAGH